MKIVVIFFLSLVTIGSFQNEEATTIQEDAIVTFLNLSNSNITSLLDFNFKEYKNLEVLDLSKNDITTIDEETFNSKLKTLNLSGNRHLQLPQYSTLLICNVETLILSDCNIQTLHDSIFDGFLNLETLDLSSNPVEIHGINTNSLSSLPRFKKLVLSRAYEQTVSDICQEIDINVEVRTPADRKTIKCEDVRSKAWKDWSVIDESTEIPLPEVLTTVKIQQQNKEQEEPVKVKSESDVGIGRVPLLRQEPQAANISSLPEEGKKEEGKNEENGQPHIIEQAENGNVSKQNVENNKEHQGEILNNAEKNNKTKDNSNQDQQRTVAETNLSEKSILSKAENGANAEPSSDKGSASTGTTVLVFLVVAVVIAGIAAFGYKYYKSRQEPEKMPIEKELREITVDRKNGPVTPPETIEEEPLMNGSKSSVEIKELNEKEKTSSDENINQKSSYIPITSVEKPTSANDKSTSSN